MDTIVCPKCGTENPANSTNCTNCRINLQFAIEHADQIENFKIESTQQEKDSTQPTAAERANRANFYALFLLPVCGIIWCLSEMMLSPPVIGPCASGGVHHDTYISLVNYWSLHLVLGYIVVVARIYVWVRPPYKGTLRLSQFLTVAIVVWILAALSIWYEIFSRLCV